MNNPEMSSLLRWMSERTEWSDLRRLAAASDRPSRETLDPASGLTSAFSAAFPGARGHAFSDRGIVVVTLLVVTMGAATVTAQQRRKPR